MASARQTIAVLDYGGQYVQLIARRVRESRVYCEIFPHDVTAAELGARGDSWTSEPEGRRVSMQARAVGMEVLPAYVNPLPYLPALAAGARLELEVASVNPPRIITGKIIAAVERIRYSVCCSNCPATCSTAARSGTT